MKIKQLIERNWYIFLVIIILFTLFMPKEPTVTSEVILNLKELNTSYELENPSQIKINTTIYKENRITSSIILDPNTRIIIDDNNFTALGEEHGE